MRLPSKVIDTASIPKADREQLVRLIDAAKSASRPPDKSGAIPGDAMSFTISIEAEGPPVIIRQSDVSMSSAFAALLDWIEKFSIRK